MDATCHGYYVQLFKGFFPKQLLQNVIDIVNEKMDGDEEVVYGVLEYRTVEGWSAFHNPLYSRQTAMIKHKQMKKII